MILLVKTGTGYWVYKNRAEVQSYLQNASKVTLQKAYGESRMVTYVVSTMQSNVSILNDILR